ncbi:Thiolase [Halococcus saccharolyticus DSM 5350]|uniref:Thiolase n=1 Tax=Halococcus saccharolyticus DSM 5350 TaxID=1227455 RepID=M0MQC6_9EURY|nr:Thiolase [Halococcus saccharolyticus DSM 5350]
MTEHVGLHGIPTTHVENAYAAGGYADRSAVTAVRSGRDDADPEAVAVGDEVRAAVRRIYEQEGVVRYGSKSVPIE